MLVIWTGRILPCKDHVSLPNFACAEQSIVVSKRAFRSRALEKSKLPHPIIPLLRMDSGGIGSFFLGGF